MRGTQLSGLAQKHSFRTRAGGRSQRCCVVYMVAGEKNDPRARALLDVWMRDKPEVIFRFSMRGARQGYQMAQVMVAMMYLTGKGTSVNPVEAQRWSEIAQNNSSARSGARSPIPKSGLKGP